MTTILTGRPDTASVVLYWLPLGAGGNLVRLNGRVFEAIVARHEHRAADELYHSALEVCIGADRFVIEMAPVWAGETADRGVVKEGPVGTRWLGRSALFRYEVRCWHNGVIPDVEEAVTGPHQVSHDRARALQLLELVPRVPALTWGRDELHVGEMWSSNSLIAWLLARSLHRVDNIEPPAKGRAPGWRAGLMLAAQQAPEAAAEPGGTRFGDHQVRRLSPFERRFFENDYLASPRPTRDARSQETSSTAAD